MNWGFSTERFYLLEGTTGQELLQARVDFSPTWFKPGKKNQSDFFSSSSSRCSKSFRRRWKPDRVWTLSRASHLLLNVFLSPLSTSSSSWMNRHRRRWSSRPQMLSLPCLARSLVFWAQESLICDRCLDKKRSFCRKIFLKLNTTLLSKQYVWHSAMIRLLNNLKNGS